MKILLPIDGSDFSKKMLAYVVTHSELFSSKNDYTVLSVQTALPPRAKAALTQEAVQDYYRQESEAVLAPACEFLQRHNLNIQSVWLEGDAGEEIARYAQEGKFDLILMGSHGHGRVASMVMGSVSNKVLAHCGVPVLLIR